MARDDGGGWPAYVPVAERRRQAERVAAKLRKKGHVTVPVRVAGRGIATTAWGRAWCDNLESYRDYESRLPRGRTYVRNGSVIDLHIGQCQVKALVSGSSVYTVAIAVAAMPAARWRSIRTDCSGRIESVVELLQGRLSKGVMDRMCRQGTGLFPEPSEISFSCSCLDHASMCKHVAAALYGVGVRLDESPELLFRLRAVDAGDLVADLDGAMPVPEVVGDRVIAAEDAAALFGLDLAGPGVVDDGGHARFARRPAGQDEPAVPPRSKRGTGRSRPAARKVAPPAAVPDESADASPAKARSMPPARSRAAAASGQAAIAPPVGSGTSSAAPGGTSKCGAVRHDAGKGLGKTEAKRVVADVFARIGKHLVAGVDVASANPPPRPGGPHNPGTASVSPAPGSKVRETRPAKTRRNVT